METIKEKIIKILKENNIKMEIGGCGCCGSPWVKFEYKGELIADDVDYFNINMFDKSTEKSCDITKK